MGKLEELPEEIREKALNDVFCIRCQQPFRAENHTEREFRGRLMIEAKCPRCGEKGVKPVGSS